MTISNRSSQALVLRRNFSHHSICLKGSPEEQKQTRGYLECLNDNFEFMWQRGNVLPVRFANKKGLKDEVSPDRSNHEIRKFRILRNNSDKYIYTLNIFQKCTKKLLTTSWPMLQCSARPWATAATSSQFPIILLLFHMLAYDMECPLVQFMLAVLVLSLPSNLCSSGPLAGKKVQEAEKLRCSWIFAVTAQQQIKHWYVISMFFSPKAIM